MRIIQGLTHVAVAATILLGLPAAASGQQLGAKAGINFTSLTPEEDEDPDTSWRPGLVAGGWFTTKPNGRVAFQAEGLFSEKGVKFNTPGFGIESVEIRLRYLEIPLLARFNFGAPTATARVYAVGGAAPAFKLGARARAVIDGVEDTADLDDAIEAFDIGLVGGMGVEFGRALIEARYTHGVRHINTDNNDPNDNIQNRVFSVTAGFRFR